MTKKLILLGVGIIALGIGVIFSPQILKGKWLSSNTTSILPTIQIGSRELIMNSFDASGPTYDMSSPTLRHPTQRDKFYTWWVNATSFKQYLGTLDAPFQTQTSGYTYSNNWNSNGFPKEAKLNEISFIHRPWMANVYKHPDGTLIGFVHVETDQYDRPDPNDPTKRIINDYTRYRQGISISTDGGMHWKYLGDVIRPQRKDGYSNLGGTPLLIVPVEENGQQVPYFYQYFNEVPLAGPRIPAVARTRVADVVAAAKLGNVSPWTKYNRNTGGWANESGMDGLASNITWNTDNQTGLSATNPTYPDRYDMHTDAVYSTALGKYILLAWEQAGYDYSPPSISDNPEVNRLNKGIYLYTSTDGINWGDRQKVYTPLLTNEENPYMFFAGGLNHPDTTDDMNTIGGNEFYIYFPDRVNHKFYRIPIIINNGAVTPPKKIMPLGDSITQANGPVTGHPGFPGGYRKKLGELLAAAGINYDFVGSSTINPAPGIDPDHNGYPGFRTDEILSRLPNWLSTSDPDAVLLHIGTNDLLQHKSTASTIGNLRQIVRQIVADPSRELYIAKIIPILDSWENLTDHPEYNTPAYWKPIVDGYNQAIVTMLSEDEFKDNTRIHIVDMTGSITDPSTGEACAIMLCETFDGLHPAQKGLNRMGILWYNAITDSTPPVITPPIPVITSPTVDQVFPSNTSTINLEWNTVSEASGYHLRVIEYTDTTKTTQTTRRYAGNTNDASPFYVYIDNRTSTSLTSLPVDPGRHYRFWIHSVINGIVSDGKEVFFSVNSNSVVVPKVLTANVVGQGTITSTPVGINCESDCNESYSTNETITLNASETPGHTFTGWSGACSGIGSCSISMTENKTVVATFTPITYTLTTSGTNGIITKSPNKTTYTNGEVVTLTAIADAGYQFSNWTGCTSTNNTCMVTMGGNKIISATFIKVSTTRVCKPWD